MAKKPQELKNTGYELFIGALSILSIANLIWIFFIQRYDDLEHILQFMNFLLSGIFIADFIYRLMTAPSRREYFFRQFGWADLLASVPTTGFKILRLIRIWRIYRLLHEYGARNLLRSLIRDRAGNALLTLLLLGILVLEFGSLAILSAEALAGNANITSASDALWYIIVTISTVGYGDRFPVTDMGRLIGSLIILTGVGIFGTFTGYLANLFLTPHAADHAPEEQPAPSDPQRKLEQLEALLQQQQAAIAELRGMINGKT